MYLRALDLASFDQKYGPRIEAHLEAKISTLENAKQVRQALAGGKRLRSKLSLLAYFLCGGRKEAKGLEVAVVTELAQSASVAKDDLLDQDAERRGQPSLWVQQGSVEAMRTADMMIGTGVRSLLGFGKDLVETFVSAWEQTWKGASQEASFLGNLRQVETPMRKAYFEIIAQKTAAIFAASAKLGAQAAGAPAERVVALEAYGLDVGILYQLADDYVDVAQGKMRMIQLAALMQMETNVKGTLFDAVEKGRVSFVDLLSRGIDVRAFFKEEMRRQLKALEARVQALPDGDYTPVAKELPRSFVNAMLKEVHEEWTEAPA